ncbi:MAG TPA: hypothetical protein PKK36_00465 [Kiritimatiellia bacterium]|nr:hypothetical protein [Kiritimatiellia bacterium]
MASGETVCPEAEESGDSSAPAETPDASHPVRRAERAFGPVLAGVLLDCVDFATMGPFAFIIGIIVGFWIFSIYRLPLQHRIIGALLAGAYCMMPFTRFLPLATLVGAWVRFRESK